MICFYITVRLDLLLSDQKKKGCQYSSLLDGALDHLVGGRVHAELAGAVDHVADYDGLGQEGSRRGRILGADWNAGSFGHGGGVGLVSLVVWLENLAKSEPGGNAWENMVMVRLRGLWGS